MIEYNLQFFGGRGSSGGESLGGGGGGNVDIVSQTDVWSYRHNQNNQPFADQINQSVADVQNDFPDVMNTVNNVYAAKFGGSDATGTLGCYGADGLSINQRFTDIEKMNNVYDKSVASKFHPSRGNKSGVEAVTYHEMGHAITDHIASKVGAKNLDESSKKIVNAAYKATKGKGGTKAWAGKISGYAQDSFAECVAEAVADVYCNGNKAHAHSKAIFKELKKYS